jgi:bifunctional DNase/RNase
VVLDGDEAGVCTTLYIGEKHDEVAFTCHPADALALAARTCAPIYATDELLRSVSDRKDTNTEIQRR